jgi:hypothetical protein
VRVNLASLAIAIGATTVARAVVIDTAGRSVSFVSVTWSVDSATDIASIDPDGRVLAVAEGTVRVVATTGRSSGSDRLHITRAQASGAMALPAPPQTFDVAFPRITGKRWSARNSEQFKKALDKAQRGDEIVLEEGATFSGNFRLPEKAGGVGDGWILVRSEPLSSMSEGVRVTPALADRMAKIVSPNSGPALATASGASGWYLAGIEITVDLSVVKQQYGIVLLGDGSGAQRTLASVPSDLVLDRMYIHGQTTTKTSRCVALNSARTAIINSYLHECHSKGFDSQAIGGWNGPGPFKIVNNTLAGAGENVMFGGADPAVPDLIPSDIEIKGNYIYTPLSWKGVWTKKNLLELKNAQRVLIEGNVLDGSWSDAQVGGGIVLKSVNQNGKCTWCASRDITVRGNLIRNVGQPFNLAGAPERIPVGESLRRVLIENTLVENVNVAPYIGDARMILLLSGVRDVTIRRNSMTTPARFSTFTTFGSDVTNVVMEGNVFSRGNYGLMGDGGKIGAAALGIVRGEKRVSNTVVIGEQQRMAYPSGTRWVPSLAAALSIPNVGADPKLRTMLGKVVIP